MPTKVADNVSVVRPPYPVEGAGYTGFSNRRLLACIFVIPFYLTYQLGLSWTSYAVSVLLLAVPISLLYLWLDSIIARPPPSSNKLPRRPLQEYMDIRDADLAARYRDSKKIPMELFFESYFDGKIDIKGDCLEMFEARHDWAEFSLQPGQAKFFLTQWIPELIWHSKKQDEDQVRDHYDRGDDFYAAFLGSTMVYTSGLISDVSKNESLEQLQENKLKHVCQVLKMQPGDSHLDIGCGWGTLVAYAAKNCGTQSVGITLGRNQTEFGNRRAESYGVGDRAKLECMDYRDIPMAKYDKISCLEMAEHVGIRRFGTFLCQVRELLEDDGLFFMQIAGLRAAWQYEDFIWGLFMAKYVFPGADASCPLYWVTKQLETNGFEVRSVNTIGVHYSATIWRWYQNWMQNREQITKSYGKRWFRIWEVFLAWSTIISRQGSATCYQILAHKNRNAFDRTAVITS